MWKTAGVKGWPGTRDEFICGMSISPISIIDISIIDILAATEMPVKRLLFYVQRRCEDIIAV